MSGNAKRIAEGMAILAGYVDGGIDECHIDALHDVIYFGRLPQDAPQLTEETPSEEHRAALDALGWLWFESEESWGFFT